MIIDERMAAFLQSFDSGKTPFLDELEQTALRDRVPIIRSDTQNLLRFLLAVKNPYQNVSAVTGACLMVKRSLYEEVGGLEERFAVSLNDVDLCLKLRKRGLLNVFTPFAELFHYESISRGSDASGERAERYNRESEEFRKKWKEMLQAGDPYYNPNFSLDRSDFSLKVNGE